MAILQTFYCCSTLKRMAFWNGLIYLMFTVAFLSSPFLSHSHHQPSSSSFTPFSIEHKTLKNDEKSPETGPSFILADGIDKAVWTSMHISMFICDISMLLSSVLLFTGLYLEKRSLLLPWIVSNSSKFVLSLAVVIFFIYSAKKKDFTPSSAFLFTLVTLYLSAQFYAIIGVISLFQEGFAHHSNQGDVFLAYEKRGNNKKVNSGTPLIHRGEHRHHHTEAIMTNNEISIKVSSFTLNENPLPLKKPLDMIQEVSQEEQEQQQRCPRLDIPEQPNNNETLSSSTATSQSTSSENTNTNPTDEDCSKSNDNGPSGGKKWPSAKMVLKNFQKSKKLDPKLEALEKEIVGQVVW